MNTTLEMMEDELLLLIDTALDNPIWKKDCLHIRIKSKLYRVEYDHYCITLIVKPVFGKDKTISIAYDNGCQVIPEVALLNKLHKIYNSYEEMKSKEKLRSILE